MGVEVCDTIAAIATPVGVGGVGVLRLSGPCAVAIVCELIGRECDSLPDRLMVYATARGRDGERLDDLLAVVMRGPRSYTGEDVAELHGHGGALNMARLLRAVSEAGARDAEPGEFTRRAFANGKIDLARAEALLGVIEAGSERAWRLSQAQLAGALGDAVQQLRGSATELLAEVEATIDFPEDDADYLQAANVAERTAELAADLMRLAASFDAGRAVVEGIEVAIIGPTNSGKSSLFNMLIGTERAIVSAEAGTTRDYVEARTVWQGVPITLIDTAGERIDIESRAEAIGLERGRERARIADLVLVVSAADIPVSGSELGAGEMRVMSKADLLVTWPIDVLATSAKSGQGIAELRAAILTTVLGSAAEGDDGAVVTTERQRAILMRAAESLKRASDAVAGGLPPEMIALEVRESCEALAEIAGERVGEEVLDALFSKFCIGK